MVVGKRSHSTISAPYLSFCETAVEASTIHGNTLICTIQIEFEITTWVSQEVYCMVFYDELKPQVTQIQKLWKLILQCLFSFRACGDSTSKRKESLVKTYIPSHVPSHWSQMPLNVQYTRVALDATSAEFQVVEKLFKQLIYQPAVIKNIYRVQNPLIWEQYCR